MGKGIVGALAVAGLIAFTPMTAQAITGVLCIKAVGKGAVKVRNTTCKPTEVQVGSFDTAAQQASFTGTAPCAGDAVRVGSVCVDKYEASVWQTTDAATIADIKAGSIQAVGDLSLATQHGVASDDYGTSCPDTGTGCLDFYAVSMPGVTPSASLTWFQAAAACRNAHKRLATNQEWQMAALGTPDPGTDNGTSDCAVNSSLSATGARSLCVSESGAFDMVGNLNEWVADWGDRAIDCTSWSATYGTDFSCVGGDGVVNLPGALMRGGYFLNSTNAGVFAVNSQVDPSMATIAIGFRCAREP